MPKDGGYKETGSLPAWERGLKLNRKVYVLIPDKVAPCVGAWIETIPSAFSKYFPACRSLRGSVD